MSSSKPPVLASETRAARVSGPHVLEVGVGTGVNRPECPATLEVDAIDLSPRMLGRARQRAGHRANTPLRRLLGGWRDVVDDIRAVCRDFENLPDVCQCGHGPLHLQGSCACCGTVTTARVPDCDDCDRQLASLRPALELLAADSYRTFPVTDEVLSRDDPAEGRRAREIERHIAALIQSFEQLVLAEGRFRSDCRASHLATLKASAAALRRDAEALNRLVTPQPENSYIKD